MPGRQKGIGYDESKEGNMRRATSMISAAIMLIGMLCMPVGKSFPEPSVANSQDLIASPAKALSASPKDNTKSPAGEPASQTEISNVDKMVATLYDPKFRVIFCITLVFGALGGLVYELTSLRGSIEYPHRVTGKESNTRFEYAAFPFLFDLGIVARLIIGALAAVAVMFVVTPSTLPGLLATALVAGSAGTSVFSVLKDRLLAALATKEATDMLKGTKKVLNKVHDLRTLMAI